MAFIEANNIEKASFAGGCFWYMEVVFEKAKIINYFFATSRFKYIFFLNNAILRKKKRAFKNPLFLIFLKMFIVFQFQSFLLRE